MQDHDDSSQGAWLPLGRSLEAVNTLRNLTPVSNMSCTPIEKWTGHEPNLSKLRIIGSKAFCEIQKSHRGGKFEPVAYMGALVNYNNSSNAYRVWDPSNAKVYNVGSLASDETANLGCWRLPRADEGDMDVEFPDLLTYTAPVLAAPLQLAIADMTPPYIADLSLDPDATPAIAVPAQASQLANLQASPAIIPDSSTQLTSPRRSNRSNRGVPPLRLAEIMAAAIDESAADEPNTFKQAMKLPDAKSWREAMVVNSLIENKVYEVVDRPAYKRVVV